MKIELPSISQHISMSCLKTEDGIEKIPSSSDKGNDDVGKYEIYISCINIVLI